MIYICIIFSFLFESVITNIVNINSFLVPLFLITSFTILYPYFKNKFNFILACILCGIIYDISFSDTIFINTISFGIIGLFIIMCYNYFRYSIYSSNIINILVILVYRVISYLLLVIIEYLNFDNSNLLKGIYSSILINLIYGIIIYLVSDLISKIFDLKRY